MRLICSWQTLFMYAREEGQARINFGEDSPEFLVAKENHDSYKELCLQADEMW